MLIYMQMISSDEDRSKFEQLYSAYSGLMYHIAYGLLKNRQDAEDAVHQAFISIIENLQKVSDVDDPKTKSYIVVITEHKAVDIIRLRARYSSETFDESFCGIEIPLPGDDGLADALSKLPARYREVLLLRFDNGLTTKELGRIFGLSRSAVQKLIWRAKQALRKALGEDDNTHELS